MIRVIQNYKAEKNGVEELKNVLKKLVLNGLTINTKKKKKKIYFSKKYKAFSKDISFS